MARLKSNECIWDAAQELSRHLGPNLRSSQSFRNYLLFQLIPSETCVTLEHECTRIK
jgi:hypothetical protein